LDAAAPVVFCFQACVTLGKGCVLARLQDIGEIGLFLLRLPRTMAVFGVYETLTVLAGLGLVL
jgi:hypothetical protein